MPMYFFCINVIECSWFRKSTGCPHSSIQEILRSSTKRNGLSKKILGDIQTYDLSKFSFDVIICHFVLEHLDDPEKALANFVRGLSHRGIIVIVAPNLFSLVGVVTKFTPFWFHRFARRILSHNKRMDTINNERFPTPFRLSMTPQRVMLFARRNGLKVRYIRMYEGWLSWLLRRKSKLAMVFFKTLQVLVKVFTLGKLDILIETYTMILERNSQAPNSIRLAWFKGSNTPFRAATCP